MVAGQERTVWDPSLSIPPRDFEFTDADVARIRSALDAWTMYAASADRPWLEPLLSAVVVPQ
jgi:hypothetical protein